MKIWLTFLVLGLPLAAAIEVGSRAVPYTSDLYGALLAALGGFLVMKRRVDEEKLTHWQSLAEVGLASLSGYIVHAWAIDYFTNPRLIWSSCIIAGCLGSKGMQQIASVGEMAINSIKAKAEGLLSSRGSDVDNED